MKKVLGYSILAILFTALVIVIAVLSEFDWWKVVAVFVGDVLFVALIVFAVNLINE